MWILQTKMSVLRKVNVYHRALALKLGQGQGQGQGLIIALFLDSTLGRRQALGLVLRLGLEVGSILGLFLGQIRE